MTAVQRKVDNFTGHVGDQYLFGQPREKTPDAGANAIERNGAAIDLIVDIGVADNRAGDQLREQGFIQ